VDANGEEKEDEEKKKKRCRWSKEILRSSRNRN